MEHYAAEIKDIDDNIAKCSAFAPADGLVFYGSEEMMRYGDVNDRIRVGSEWYSDGPIMTIPDLSAFQVEVAIAEVYRGRVSQGMPAAVTVEAVPGLVLNGSLLTVASVARNKISWDSSSPQVFDATLALTQVDPRMVQGMTVKVEITTAEFSDVLSAPIEAVFNEGGKPAVFKWIEADGKGHAEKWPVQTGQVNDHFVEIRMGLNEGDRLLLSRPAVFITPRNYREMADAVAPAPEPPPIPVATSTAPAATTAAALAPGAATAPASPAIAPAVAPEHH
jgi:multidrug efflux pump subunit AcrA (membrane-fusion protein)